MTAKSLLRAPFKKLLAMLGYQILRVEGPSGGWASRGKPTPATVPSGTPLPLWEQDMPFQAIRKLMEGQTIVGTNDSYMLYQFALHVRANVQGDVAEVGVYKGGTAKLLAKAFESTGQDIHLFDTFGGMPPTDAAMDVHREGDFGDVTFDEVRDYLSDCPRTHLYKGFFPDTATPIESRTFSFVHVDVDIYLSVLACCRFFYPRLASGGVMIFDDYGRVSCPGAKAAVDEFFAGRAEHPIYSGHSHSAQAFILKI
jgi:O-methyltransferase